MRPAKCDPTTPTLADYGLGERLADLLMRADAADALGDTTAAAAFREQARRLTHLQFAREAAFKLVVACLPAIAGQGLAGTAHELMSLLERMAEAESASSPTHHRKG